MMFLNGEFSRIFSFSNKSVFDNIFEQNICKKNTEIFGISDLRIGKYTLPYDNKTLAKLLLWYHWYGAGKAVNT